jgi:hypothetical protein
VFAGLVSRERVAGDPQRARDAGAVFVALAGLMALAIADPEATTDGILDAIDPRVPLPSPAAAPASDEPWAQAAAGDSGLDANGNPIIEGELLDDKEDP